MASYVAAEEVSEKMKRIFRDRTSQLELLTEGELISRYRLPRHAIFSLLEKVRPHIEHGTKRSHAISPETQLLVTLRYLSKDGFLMEIGDLHGVHESSVSRSVHRTIRAINNVLDIKFNPDANKVRMQDFYKIAEFPCVIGAIDGTLIPIKRPPADEEVAYVCRKGFHAINVQAVCDANLR
ncbi:putative nuclease HARBI1 [Haliotis rubra]|uniref:putative nuclease HARBI1 n=1 Tax=Haliotis rubra TaxID=36100 RepID=UPI001EE55FCA|nr:putative nuclease HARBI1 [Haliotis rubra]